MKIANKLGLTTISIAIAASAVFGYFTYSNLKSYLYDHESEWQRTVAEGLMQKIDHALYLAKRDMRILSEDEFLQNFVANPHKTQSDEVQEVEEELEERLELTGPWQSLIVVDQNGRQIIHIHNTRNHPEISQYPESNVAYLKAMKGEIYHSDYVTSDLTGKPTVIFAAPIYKRCAECSPKERAIGKTDRSIVGAIIAHYRWSQIQGILNDAGPNLVPHLFNGKGELIATTHHDVHEVAIHTLHPMVEKAMSDDTHSHGVTFDYHQEEPALSIVVKQLATDNSGSSQWSLLLEQPVKTVFQGLDKIIVQITISLILSILLLTVVIVTVMQKTIQPLVRLSRQINKIGEGDFETRLEVGSHDEIGVLAENFNEMSEQLLQRSQALQASEARFKEVAKTIPNVLYTIRLDDFVPLYVSPAVETLLGYDPKALMAPEDHLWLKSLHPEDKQRVLETLNPPLIDRKGYELEFRMLHRDDGHVVRTFEDKGNWVYDDEGKVVAVQGILTEITERKEYIDQLQKSSRALHALHAVDTLLLNTESPEDLVQGACHHLVYQEGYSFVWVGLFSDKDAKNLELTAYDGNDDTLTDQLRQQLPSEDLGKSAFGTGLNQQKPVIINDTENFERMAEIEMLSEEQRYRSLACFPLSNQAKTFGVICFYGVEPRCFSPEEVHLLSQIADNLTFGLASLETQEEHQKAVSDIQYNAFHDPLTGLANRSSLMLSLEQAINTTKRTGESLALLFVDLDEFKLVNDTLGHEVGDKLLQEVGKRIHSVIREADLLARQGGDEFIVLMQGINHCLMSEEQGQEVTPANLAQRILDVLSQPFTIEEEAAYIGASVGISACPHDGTDAQALLRFSESAMYKAKELGRGTYQFFSRDLTQKQQYRLTQATQLHHALENQQFVLFYQPVIELATGKMVGVEALIRLQKESGEIVSPDEFLPIAEDTGLIVPIGEWVVQEACRQAKKWRAAGLDLHIAINLSARQFWQQDLAEQVMRIIHSFDLPSNAIIVEITETAMSLDEQRVESMMESFHKGGMTIYLDDFGTGYSSLSRLKHLPINTLKIDKTFVDGVPEDKENLSIVDATLKLASSLGMDALAEGIETETQFRWLQERHCRYGQGFYFSCPLPEDQLEALYRSREDWR